MGWNGRFSFSLSPFSAAFRHPELRGKSVKQAKLPRTPFSHLLKK